MKVLIAVNPTRETLRHTADAPDGHGDAVDGEVVTPVLLECTEPDRCRCDRAWAGLSTAGFAPLAEVADRPNLTRAAMRAAIHDLLDRVGWIDDVVQAVDDGAARLDGVDITDAVWATECLVDDHLEQIERICASFPVGTTLSRLGDLVAPTVESRAA